jgi:hypothetical protein
MTFMIQSSWTLNVNNCVVGKDDNWKWDEPWYYCDY